MTRLRVLMLLLVTTAIVALWRWSPAPDAVTVTRVPHAPAPVAQQGDTAPHGWQPMDDSTFAATMKDFVVMTVYGDSAWFVFAGPADSLADPADLGLIPATALLDTTRRFDVVGDDGVVRRVAVISPQAVDSGVRHMDTACSVGVPVRLRDVAPRRGDEGHAFISGSAEAVQASRWQAEATDADRTVAIELARFLPPPPRGDGSPPDTSPDPFARSPYRIAAVRRFTIEGVEFLIGDVRRSAPLPSSPVDSEYRMEEQRIFIAERSAGDAGKFRLGWWAQGTDMGEGRQLYQPTMLLRLGPQRLLTVIMDASYGDGGGDDYLVRVAPATWRLAASTYVGC